MNLKDLSSYLNQKNKLSLRNIRTSQEVWHIFVSRLNLILAGISLLLVMFAISITVVAYTPILDLIPGYPGNKSRATLMENIMRLDSIETQVRYWENYQRNLSMILQGQVQRRDDVKGGADSLTRSASVKGNIMRRTKSDTALRMQMTLDSVYILRKDTRKAVERSFEMMQPVMGQLKESFAPVSGRFGVEIAAQPEKAVMAVMDGTVISAPWSPQSGYTITVQHSGNMLSVYSNVSRLLVGVGSRVKAGQAIGLTPSVKDGMLPVLVFELWQNGNAVDPENYITF